MKKYFIFLFLIISLLRLLSDENHFINIMIGDRAAGLAGAYTAIADGPEGVYYNPAGIAYSAAKYFSISVNAIFFKMLRYEKVYKTYDNKDFDYYRYSISFLPNFFGFIQKTKYFTFGITIACIDSEYYNQKDSARIKNMWYADSTPLITDFNINFNYTNWIYEAGLTFAFLPHKKVSVGFSLLARYRSITGINQITYQTDPKKIYDGVNYDNFQTSSVNENHNIIGFNPQFGIQVMPIKQLSIGYCYSMPMDFVNINSIQVTQFREDKFKAQNETNWTWYPVTSESKITNNKLNTNHIGEKDFLNTRPIIIKQALGFGVFITKSLLISLDGYLYIPIQNDNVSKNDKLNIIGNGAVGIEWYITPNFPLRAGFFTNLTNRQPIEKGDVNKKDYINIFGGSLTFGYSTSDLAINIGTVISGGYGEAQIIANSTDIQKVTNININLFISGGYQF